MKAAVVFKKGELPTYVEDFPLPFTENESQILISVKASAIKQLDKMRASGKHYSTENTEWKPMVVGGDGVGILQDGTRVYGIGISGMMAEKALIKKDSCVKLPENIDNTIAAALPNAVMGSALALKFRANLQKGETVLINGATGFTGKIAVQLAKLYGAKKIIATGRNEQSLKKLLSLGADEIISLRQENQNLISQFKEVHKQHKIDVVIDYLWGWSAELILTSLKGKGEFTHHTRYITIGGMTSDTITLSSSILRSTDIQLSGSGIGSWSKDETRSLITKILPEMFQLAASGHLKVDIEEVDLKDIEEAWQAHTRNGVRLVATL